MSCCYTPPLRTVCPTNNTLSNCPIYKVILGDVLTYTVPKSVHNLQDVRGISVFGYDGNEIILQKNVALNKDVNIYSNVSLINSTLIIY